MKKLVKVVYEKEIEVEIDDKLLTEDALKEFSSYMWQTDVNGLFQYAAKCAFSGDSFIEGLGPACSKYFVKEGANVKYEVIYEDDTEILEEE